MAMKAASRLAPIGEVAVEVVELGGRRLVERPACAERPPAIARARS